MDVCVLPLALIKDAVLLLNFFSLNLVEDWAR